MQNYGRKSCAKCDDIGEDGDSKKMLTDCLTCVIVSKRDKI